MMNIKKEEQTKPWYERGPMAVHMGVAYGDCMTFLFISSPICLGIFLYQWIKYNNFILWLIPLTIGLFLLSYKVLKQYFSR